MATPTTTAQRVFDLAMGLMAEVNENTGVTDTSETKEYKVRTLFILNALRGELYPYSDTFDITDAGKRPILPVIDSFDSVIGMDDYICQSIMPYGLAAHLQLDENTANASFFMQRYEELRDKLARGIPAVSESIEDVYGGSMSHPYNDFSRWG